MQDKYTVSLFGSGETIDGLNESFTLAKRFELIQTIPDPSIDKNSFEKEYELFQKSKKPNICLVSDYRKRIEYFDDNSLWLNIHAGILPSYRGFSSNSWAILNNETEVGYTLHLLEYELDSGPIYYQKKFKINTNEHYQDIRPKIIEHIISKTPKNCEMILEKKLNPLKQDESLARYCGKLKPEDGYIYNFSSSSQSFHNIFRIFAKPLGSGVFYISNSEKFEVKNVYLPKYLVKYYGIEGTVVNKTNDIHWIKTTDSVIGIEFANLNKNIGSRL